MTQKSAAQAKPGPHTRVPAQRLPAAPEVAAVVPAMLVPAAFKIAIVRPVERRRRRQPIPVPVDGRKRRRWQTISLAVFWRRRRKRRPLRTNIRNSGLDRRSRAILILGRRTAQLGVTGLTIGRGAIPVVIACRDCGQRRRQHRHGCRGRKSKTRNERLRHRNSLSLVSPVRGGEL